MKKYAINFLVRFSQWVRKSPVPLLIPAYVASFIGIGPALILILNLTTMGERGASAPIPLLGYVRWILESSLGTKIGIGETVLIWQFFVTMFIYLVLHYGVLLPLLKLARRKEREFPEYWLEEADRLSKRPELAQLLSPLRNDPLGSLRDKVTAISESDFERITLKIEGLRIHKEKLGVEIAGIKKSLSEEEVRLNEAKRQLNLYKIGGGYYD